MHYVLKVSKGIQTFEDYPYVGKVERCKADKNKYVTGISKVTAVKSGDEAVLEESVYNNGPNSVAIDAGSITRMKNLLITVEFVYHSYLEYNYKPSRVLASHLSLVLRILPTHHLLLYKSNKPETPLTKPLPIQKSIQGIDKDHM